MEETTRTVLSQEERENYGKFIGGIVADAIREIEKAAGGRKVMSITFPKPCAFDDPEKTQLFNVKFAPEKPSPKRNNSFWCNLLSPSKGRQRFAKAAN